MEDQDKKDVASEEEQFYQEVAKLMGLRGLEDLPNELVMSDDPVPAMSRWLK